MKKRGEKNRILQGKVIRSVEKLDRNKLGSREEERRRK